MNASARRSLILERVSFLGEVDFSSLSKEFDVSEMTIRRDIESLEAQNVVRRIIGGAISLNGKSSEPPFEMRAAAAASEKSHLAQVAVQLLKPHETVILDSGSTVLAVARAIRGRGLALTVVTPSILSAIELADEPDTVVLLTGGKLRPGELSLIGSEAEDAFRRYNCDVYVMGVAGIDADRGASEYHRDEGNVKRYACRAADKVIAVVDKSKLGRVQLVNVAALSEIDVIVTDADPDHPVLIAARAAGVDVYCAADPVETPERTLP